MVSVESTLVAVTVYQQGALCVRHAALQSTAERTVALSRLPLCLEPGSLRARLVGDTGGVTVQDVRPQMDVVLARDEDVPAQQQALEAAQELLTRLIQQRTRLDAEIQELLQLRPVLPQSKKGEPPREAPVAAVLALAEFCDAQLKARHATREQVVAAVEEAQRAQALAHRRLQETSTAQRTQRAQLWRMAVVTLSAPPPPGARLELEYQVPGARWVPGYALQLATADKPAQLRMRASVAQDTGEDWSNIELSLSTASLQRRADAPELKALKIGRRQAEPPRSGWREPPAGLDDLFEAFDAALPRALPPPPPPPPPPPAPPPADAGPGGMMLGSGAFMPMPQPPKDARRDTASGAPPVQAKSKSAPAPQNAPPPGAAPRQAAMAAPASPAASMMAPRGGGGMARMRREAEKEALADEAPMEEEGFGGAADGGVEPAPAMPAGPSLAMDLQDYARLHLPDPGAAPRDDRGRLRPLPPWEGAFAVGIQVQVDVVVAAVVQAQNKAGRVANVGLPARCAPVTTVQSFDYRYRCQARVDVPSTGAWVTVPVMECGVGLTAGYLCVPSVEAKVFRTLTVHNRSPHALLPGPVDVTQGDTFLLTTVLPPIPPGAAHPPPLGLGVEEGIRVARRTLYKENTGGFLQGGTALTHDVEVELNNRLGVPAVVEVRERVPVPAAHEKDLKVEEGAVQPPWEKPTPSAEREVRGSRRWKVTVAPGAQQKLTAQFTIKMPADKMVHGGNRRV